MDVFATRTTAKTIPIVPLTKSEFSEWADDQSKTVQTWLASSGFQPAPGRYTVIPDRSGKLASVVTIVEDAPDIWSYAALSRGLPRGRYVLKGTLDEARAHAAALGWALGTYRFSRYKADTGTVATLVWPEDCEPEDVLRQAEGIALGRDLINTPASDMGPEELAAAAEELAGQYGAECDVIIGEDLLQQGFPAVHAVGRASSRPPRLIDLTWGDDDAPAVTLVGKGVCFDSGGLDLKNARGMKLMKKDMGGAATVLALAHMIMDAQLELRLRVLIPAVENSVSGDAFRPLDVLETRKGITVEVGNTDAEGRLILCDALAAAIEDEPELLVDAATLTGAARVALGTDLPAMFCNDEALADELLEWGLLEDDPLWRLPLHRGYRKWLESEVADISNTSSQPSGGAITAALFLQEFVPDEIPWIHIDTMGWNVTSSPGRPSGGEIFGARAMYGLVCNRYG